MDPYNQAMCGLFDGIKIGLLNAMKNNGVAPEKIKALSQALNTEEGKLMLSKMIGYGILTMSTIGQDPRAQKLADMFLNGAPK